MICLMIDTLPLVPNRFAPANPHGLLIQDKSEVGKKDNKIDSWA
jgi:hypothetical protein